jgi:hypothetical protein
MPLLDHFHPPLSARRHWQAFHSAWASSIVRYLNEGVLPPRYFAEPTVEIAGPVEIDVATLRDWGGPSDGGAATAVWAPPRPDLDCAVDWAGIERFEVRIISDEEGPSLVAAIELVSPGNKDRASHRQAFVTKCTAYLQSGVSLVVVDVVTSRTASLQTELFRILGVPATAGESPLSAGAFRSVKDRGRLEGWMESLAIGEPLPTLPLWIAEDLAVPVDFEATYQATCTALRIPPEGK